MFMCTFLLTTYPSYHVIANLWIFVIQIEIHMYACKFRPIASGPPKDPFGHLDICSGGPAGQPRKK